MSAQAEPRDLEAENHALRERLADAESVLQAIRQGEIDAVVVRGTRGDSVFTLEGADHPYRMLVESMNEGAATVTPDGVILYGNPGLARLVGVPSGDLVGTRLADWLAAADGNALHALLARCTEQPATGEFELRSRSGEPLPALVSFSSLRLHDGPVCCAIVTDLRLAKHHAALEAASAAARAANERLREADHQKDEFLAVLAHELRNPLAPLRAAAHVFKMIELEDLRLIHAREMIERQVKHMARLVDDLMDLARLSLGKISLEPRTESLTTLLAGVADAAQSIMAAARHEFTVELGGGALWIDADTVRLSQAISNVLHNAAKYTPPGGRITLAAAREADQAVVRISDTGIGIAPEMLPRIFEMFVQVERRETNSQGGVGIGLALSRRLIEMHGGSIEASSRGLGCGSEFTLRLPLSRQEQARTAAGAEERRTKAVARRVVVVDDNVDAAESLGMLLELHGHQVTGAHTGARALEVLQQVPADVVLLDIGLPDLDGYEVARRLRRIHGAQCPTLIAVSGWGQPEDKRRALEAGFDLHLTKPLDPEHLAGLFERSRSGVSG